MVRTSARKALKQYFDDTSGLTRTQLARAVGVSGPSLLAWVSGTSRPKEHYRRALERLIGIPADDWMTNAERAVFADVSPVKASVTA